MKISVVVPNYNGVDLLEKNVSKIIDALNFYFEKTKEEGEIIIVDDASTDDSVAYIKNQIANSKNTDKKLKIGESNIELKIVENQKNLGFSPTVNRGVKEVNGEIVVLLNSDVTPEKDFLLPLLKHFEDSEVFAVGCMDKSVENGSTVLRGRGIGVWRNGFFVHARGEVDKTNTLWVNGGSGAFRRSIWEKLGGFNELYAPFYWEDIDLSYRALKSGYKLIFEPKSVVVHEHEKGAIKTSVNPEKVKSIAYRNQFIFVWSNATDTDLQLFRGFWELSHFLKALLRGDIPFFLGYLRALILFPKIMQSYSRSQPFFKKSDSEVVAPFVQEFRSVTS